MPAPSRTPPARRMPGLDGLRGLAALAVVVLHVWMYTEANTASRSVFVDAVIGELRVAVGLFFVLSGFLLARPWIAAARGERPRPDVGRYAIRRIARIGPAYWVALAGSFLLLQGTGHGRSTGAGALPVFALFLENMFSATRGKLDPPMWSLGIEVAFYVALPLVGWALVRAARSRAVVGPARGVRRARRRQPRLAARRHARRLAARDDVDAADVPRAVRVRHRRGGAGARPAAGARLCCGPARPRVGRDPCERLVAQLRHRRARPRRRRPAAAVGFAAVVAVVATRPAGVLASAPLRALGAVSYGVYLWHMPVLLWLSLHGLFPADVRRGPAAHAAADARARRGELVARRAPGPAVGRAGEAERARGPPADPRRRPGRRADRLASAGAKPWVRVRRRVPPPVHRGAGRRGRPGAGRRDALRPRPGDRHPRRARPPARARRGARRGRLVRLGPRGRRSRRRRCTEDPTSACARCARSSPRRPGSGCWSASRSGSSSRRS